MRHSVLTISNVALQLAIGVQDLDVICMCQKEAFHIDWLDRRV